MKKALSLILACIICCLYVVSSFAATYRGEGFYFDSELDLNFYVEEDGSFFPYYIYEEDWGSGKPADFYFHEFEYENEDDSFEIEVEEYFGRFEAFGYYAETSADYYNALEGIADEFDAEITEFAGCPAVIIEDTDIGFECYVCNDKYMYSIDLTCWTDTPTESFTKALNAVKSIRFTEKYSGSVKPQQSQNNNAVDNDGNQQSNAINNTYNQQENNQPIQNNTALTSANDNSTLIIVLVIVAAVIVICTILILTRKKK